MWKTIGIVGAAGAATGLGAYMVNEHIKNKEYINDDYDYNLKDRDEVKYNEIESEEDNYTPYNDEEE